MAHPFVNLQQERADNLGGVELLWYTAAANLVSFLARGPLLLRQLELRPGALWYVLRAVRGSVKYAATAKPMGRHGEATAHKLTGDLARHTPGLAAALEKLRGGRFVVLYRDLNGQVQLLGTPTEPLEFTTSYSTGTETARNGYDWQFTGDTIRPARPYQGTWLVAEGGLQSSEGMEGGPLPGSGGSGGPVGTRSFVATTSVGDIATGDEVTVMADKTGDAMEIMLTPDSPATATLQASSPLRQKGASTAVSLAFTVTPGTNPITNVVVAGQQQRYTDGSPKLAGTVSTTTAASTDTTFQLVATDSTGATVQASAQVAYQSRRFWGGMGQDPFSLSDVQLSAVLRTLGGQEFSTSRAQSMAVTLVEEFIVVARPAELGAGSYKVNGLPNNAFSGKTFHFTNSDGFGELYRIERSAMPDSGTFNLTVD
jgi:hypothetical protein